MRSHRRKPKPLGSGDDQDSLLHLDTFSEENVVAWNRRAELLQRFHYEFFFGLEAQRATYREQLFKSLQDAASPNSVLKDWKRIVDYQFSLDPCLMWVVPRT